MRKRAPEPGMNMTPMIDIVFQLIIFFVLTVDLSKKAVDDTIRLGLAPHGPVVEKKDPREINIDVDANGKIRIARTVLSPGALQSMLKSAVNRSGLTTPVVIRGDGEARHEAIKQVMDICAGVGLWKVKFSAIKEKNQ